jgi:hypothetical protein
MAGAHASIVQQFPSSQLVGPPELQTPPPLHVSPVVQAFPSWQLAVLFVEKHPVTGSQLSFVHTLLSSHATAEMSVFTQPDAGSHESIVQTLLSLQASVPVPVWHVPPLHVSPRVQAFPSLQAPVLFE